MKMTPPWPFRHLSALPSPSVDRWLEFLTLAGDVTGYGLMLLDKDGIIRSWNVGAERMHGYRSDEAIGHHVSLLYPPDDVRSGRTDRNIGRAARQGSLEDEGWRRRRDGTRFWAEVVLTALKDDQGRLAGFLKITRDLTERKRLEDIFRISVESAPSGMLLVDS